MAHDQHLRDVYAALNDKDVDAVLSSVADDAVFHVLPNPVIAAATLRGRTEIAGFLNDQFTQLDAHQEIDAISVNGDFATVYVSSRSTAEDGSEVTVRWADLFRFDGDKIAEYVSLAG